MSIIEQLNAQIEERQRQLKEADERLALAKRLLAPLLDGSSTTAVVDLEALKGKKKVAAADKPRKRHFTPGHKNLYARKQDGTFIQYVIRRWTGIFWGTMRPAPGDGGTGDARMPHRRLGPPGDLSRSCCPSVGVPHHRCGRLGTGP